MARTLDSIIEIAKRDLLEAIKLNGLDGAEDEIHEIADSAVPIYTSDLMQVFADDPSLAYIEPELGHGTAGNNMVGKAQAIIYEEVTNALHEYHNEVSAEVEDLQNQIEELEAEIEDLEEEIEENDSIEGNEGRGETLRERLEDLREDLRTARDELENL